MVDQQEEVRVQLEREKTAQDSIDTARAYNLIKEQENHKKAYTAVWSSLLRLSDNK